MSSISKVAFYTACLLYVQQRLDQARIGMTVAQESSNSETKSSAGDKYETGRAMAQQERDRYAMQLHEAQQLMAVLQKIKPELACDAVRPGALVSTSLGLFYIGIGAGRLATSEGLEFLAVSPAAPVAIMLSGKSVGDELMLNGKKMQILAIS